MYAILENGGKNYKVSEGDTLFLEELPADEKEVMLDKILLLSDGKEVKVGSPYLDGVKVHVVVEERLKDRKVIVFKYKPKTKYRRKKGHRQQYYKVRVERIDVGSGDS